MMRKKLVIPVIFVFIFIISMLSGCIYPYDEPVYTSEVRNDGNFEKFHFYGYFYPECDNSGHLFVVDSEKHDNWEDYAIKITPAVNKKSGYMYDDFEYRNIPVGVTHYVKAVVYCSNFRGKFSGWEDGWYTGEDRSFIRTW